MHINWRDNSSVAVNVLRSTCHCTGSQWKSLHGDWPLTRPRELPWLFQQIHRHTNRHCCQQPWGHRQIGICGYPDSCSRYSHGYGYQTPTKSTLRKHNWQCVIASLTAWSKLVFPWLLWHSVTFQMSGNWSNHRSDAMFQWPLRGQHSGPNVVG